ncbi:hypothetical protein [Clostridium perfringens]|uniref:hypothetical protein n=1 Tax=Clostridium perfringens TaxID=1502 RepID=UPI001FB1044A|nr:hypothetical protein [Clostridium perfringens]
MLEKDGLIKLGKREQRGRKRSIHIIDLNKKIKENVSEKTIKNLIKFSKKQVDTNNDVFSEKVNSLEKDSIGLLLFENRTFIKRIFSDYEKVYEGRLLAFTDIFSDIT